MMETGLEFDSKLWDRPPKRDMAVRDGDTLKLGDTTVRFMVTPGHTLGTISPVFDVRHEGQVHTVMIWGGTSFNFGRDMGRLDSYIAQTERMRQLSAQWGIDVPLSNHPGFDGTVAKLKARAMAPKGANPFISGQPVVDRAMRVLNTCARAQKARFLLTAQGGAGGVYSATGARESAGDEVAQVGAIAALRHEDDVHVAAAGLAHDEPAAAVPVVFPYGEHAGDHDGLCAHVMNTR
jgi:metallo-beta-lactamase class B